MKNKKKVILGIIIILAGFSLYIAGSIFTSHWPNLRILSPIMCAIWVLCFFIGARQIQWGRDPKAAKQKQIEDQDERNKQINGKAAYIAFFSAEFMLLPFCAYIFHVQENEILGLIGYGIAMAAILVYTIACGIIRKKM